MLKKTHYSTCMLYFNKIDRAYYFPCVLHYIRYEFVYISYYSTSMAYYMRQIYTNFHYDLDLIQGIVSSIMIYKHIFLKYSFTSKKRSFSIKDKNTVLHFKP